MNAPVAEGMWLPWLVASLLCIATPGTDSLGTLSMGLSRGRREGMSFGIGVGLGCLTHTLWAALGIAAVVAASAALFTAIKLAGAAYLLWLGVQCLREHGGVRIGDADAPVAPPAVRARRALDSRLDVRIVRQGFVSNAVNPKVMLFFLAFIPQFVDPAAGPVWLQMTLFGTGFALLTGSVYALLGASAGRVGGWLRGHASAIAWMNRLTGVLFIALAARLALAERR